MHKGQVVTLDLIFALVIGMAVFFALNHEWGIAIQKSYDYTQRNSAEIAAHSIALSLISSKGYPEDWNRTTVMIVGIAKNLDVIDGKKFNELMALPNASLGDLLGVSEFKIMINLTSSAGTTINSTGLAPANYSILSTALSFVSFNNNVSKLYVTVWK